MTTHLQKNKISNDVISNLCNETKLERNAYLECNMSTGTTLAFFSGHDFEKGKELCKLIKNTDAMNYCIEGLLLEIQDSERYESAPLTERMLERSSNHRSSKELKISILEVLQ